jgi:hypothetical protein
MNLEDGDEKDEEGRAKDKNINFYLNWLGKEQTDNCFVDLEISIYSWINSVAQAPSRRNYSDVRIDKKRCYILVSTTFVAISYPFKTMV